MQFFAGCNLKHYLIYYEKKIWAGKKQEHHTQCFNTVVLKPNQTHLIQVSSSLVETPRPEIGSVRL